MTGEATGRTLEQPREAELGAGANTASAASSRPHSAANAQPEVPWLHRIATRLTLLLLGVIAVLAAAMAVLLWRGLGGMVTDGVGPAATVDPQTVRDVLRGTLFNLAAVVAVTVIAAVAFSRSLLADPIARLTAATRQLAAGDREVRLRSADASEVGELARSFDGMAEALQSAHDRLEARVAARTAELRGLLELSNTIAVTAELKPQLVAVLTRLVETGEVAAAEVLELEPTGRLTNLASLGEVPVRAISLTTAAEETASLPAEASAVAPSAVIHGDALALPLRARDSVVGVLHAYTAGGVGWTEERLRLARGLASQAAVAIENARLYERAREQAADEERRHLARELHDSVSQAIYAVVLTSHAARERLATDPARSSEALDSVIGLAEAALAEMRALIFELRPEALAEVGLVGALERQLDGLELRHGLQTERHLAEEPELPFAVKQVILRVAQEALHNIAKHAHAKLVTVRSRVAAGSLRLEISDDGIGFDPNRSYPGHLGLTSMHERIGALGGKLRVTSTPGAGTTVTAELPLETGRELAGGAAGEVAP